MLDIVYLATGLGFFVVCVAAIHLCADLLQPRN